ncbi:MAG: Translocation and assembly module TamA, partial [Candidatus Anoxychlamydiales bacterium]|nr:Translocation and assembly module TamA [Candidatus Anoxychlamydiales bacterium]
MQFLRKIFFLAFILPACLFALNYDVKFTGLKDKNTIQAIRRVSSLVILQKRPPKTINALRFRASSDVTEILKVLHFFGFYDAKIDIDLEENKNMVVVNVLIMPGVRYTIKDVKIYTDCLDKKQMDIESISINDLDLKINSALITQNILNAEKKLIFLLSNKGYPLAKVEKRDVVIDQTHKNALVEWCVNIGSFSLFGDTKITGLKSIAKSYIDKKIKWIRGQKYDSRKVNETQQNLLKTNLFSSVAIAHEDTVNEQNELEMNLKLVESLHRYISTGVSYATVDG